MFAGYPDKSKGKKSYHLLPELLNQIMLISLRMAISTRLLSSEI